MLIRRYTYVDVYYNKGQSKKARREKVRLLKMGYELQARDTAGGHDKKTGNGFDYCDQYLKQHRSREL